MSHESITHWVEKAKTAGGVVVADNGVRVVHGSDLKTRGGSIIEIAEKLRPSLAKMFEGVRDENGMLVQPARIRGIALNLAQFIVKNENK
ncbi:MAG: hypothetical protein AB7L92_08055 [Alphaproteobacteria bacterium]